MKRITLLVLSLAAMAAVLLSRPVGAQAPTVIIPSRKPDLTRPIAFSFSQADIDDVLRFLAEATGKMVFKDSDVVTSITIRNTNPMPINKAIELVQTVLSYKNYVLEVTDDALIVRSDTKAKLGETPVSAGRDLAGIPKGKQIITHIFPLNTVDAARLRQDLQPIFGQGGGILMANGDTNSLIVVDRADRVRAIAQLILQVDRDITDEVNLEVIKLEYADATEVARYMTDLFRPDETRGGGGGNPFGGGGPGGMMAPAQPGGLSQLRGRVRFAADARANALLVYANPANIKAVREIIKQIDVNLLPRTEYRIIELKFADPTSISDQLNQILDPNARTGGRGGFGGFFGFGGSNNNNSERGFQDYRVVPDVRTNSLIVTAPVDGIETLENLVEKLDRPSQVETVVQVFSLKNAIASEVATTLRNLFLGTTQQGGNFGFGLFGQGNRTQIPPGSPLDLLRQVTIVPNDQTNQLLISGPKQTFAVIESLLREDTGLDRRLPQVFIEVVIADITLDDETKYGIEWNALAGTSAAGTNFGLTSPTADTTGFRYSVLSKNFQATLQALKSNNKVRIASTPHVLVTDNSPALISIGERIPYAGETTITNGVAQTSVEFQDVSITLNVTPHISPGNHVMMDIDQVVNSLIEFINVGQNQTAPRTTNRRAGTTVIVQNDQTVVLGGIISDDEQKNEDRVPILGSIPFLGQLFRNTRKSKSRTELVVFLTPHIVVDFQDADKIREYEQNRLRVDPLKTLEVPFVKPPTPAPTNRDNQKKGMSVDPKQRMGLDLLEPLDLTPADIKRRAIRTPRSP